MAAGPERLNQEGFAAFAARTGKNAPVGMLNLLRFKPDGGRERYGSDEYRAIAHLRTEALTEGELHPLDPATLTLS